MGKKQSPAQEGTKCKIITPNKRGAVWMRMIPMRHASQKHGQIIILHNSKQYILPSQPECLKKIDQHLQSLIFRRNSSRQKNIHKLIVSFTRVVFFHQLSAEKVFSGQWNDWESIDA